MTTGFEDAASVETAIELGDEYMAICTCGSHVRADYGTGIPRLDRPDAPQLLDVLTPLDGATAVLDGVRDKMIVAADHLTKLLALKHGAAGVEAKDATPEPSEAPTAATGGLLHPEADATAPARGETQFFLVDISGGPNQQEVLAEITPGAEIDASLLEGREVTVVATTGDEVESIAMRMVEREGGQTLARYTKTENIEPYSLFGDANGDFRSGIEFNESKYVIRFEAFSEDRAGGQSLDDGRIAFRIVDDGGSGPGTNPDDPLANGPITSYTSGGAARSSFNIDLTFVGSGWTVEIQREFIEAMDLLSELILGDLPDVNTSAGLVDDIAITATLQSIDGRGGTLAFAGPTSVRPGEPLPSTGSMTFDTADLSSQLSRGSLDDVIFHEALHALGFGTLFNFAGLYDSSANRYTGAFGTATYNDEFAGIAAGDPGSQFGIPTQQGGGHLDEGRFGNEIMTPFLGSNSFLSATTVAILEDLGYDTILDNPFDPTDRSGPAPDTEIFADSLLV